MFARPIGLPFNHSIIKLNQRQMTDREAYDRMISGDKSGFFWMFQAFEAPFVQWIGKEYDCPELEAEQLFEEAAITVFQNIQDGKYIYNSTVKTYLFTVGKYKWFGVLRKLGKLAAQPVPDPDAGSYDFEREEQLLRAEAAMQQLGEKCRQLLEMRIISNLSYEEIAKILTYKNVDVVKNAKHKCLEQLRRLMRKPDSQPL